MPKSSERIAVDRAEAVLIEQYPRLVRLAYLTLPDDRGRHRRVLDAHRLVQRALPRTPRRFSPGPDQDVYGWLRTRVIRAALRARRPHGVPSVVGLRLFPRAGGAVELGLDRRLSEVAPGVRAAYALLVLEQMSEAEVRRVTGDAESVLHARTLHLQLGPDGEQALKSSEFDPCVVQTTPDDLLRRRRNSRLAAAGVCALVLAGCGTLVAHLLQPTPAPLADPAGGKPAVSRALDPDRLVRADPRGWADTSRVDLTAWPARGDRTRDSALLSRALRVWDHPADSVRRTVESGASTEGPSHPPQLLYAGTVEDRHVALFYDGDRTVRYSEPARAGGSAATLDIARSDNSDVTDASALTLVRTRVSARYLLAPWVSESGLRDLRKPDSLPRPLPLAGGVTPAVALPPAKGCGSWPALQLRSSAKIVENHRFLLTDLGGFSPVHLTYQPLPGKTGPASASRRPVEATSSAALVAWSRTSCGLPELDPGVRSVNTWDFARQKLPGGGSGTWNCMRADTWKGPGQVLIGLRPSTGRPLLAGSARNTAACSRYGQHVVAEVEYRTAEGERYLLAAGSRAITELTAAGKTSTKPTLAVHDPEDDHVEARTRTGQLLTPLGRT
ncbi:hypothetical protein [Streptomyces sp. NPDC047123]|uniref:hypothetical protein n=1 Tax=Streptomyces sp. NPDC047123 TaxID=3155622 RepID=UPI0033ED8ADD